MAPKYRLSLAARGSCAAAVAPLQCESVDKPKMTIIASSKHVDGVQNVRLLARRPGKLRVHVCMEVSDASILLMTMCCICCMIHPCRGLKHQLHGAGDTPAHIYVFYREFVLVLVNIDVKFDVKNVRKVDACSMTQRRENVRI